MPLCPVNVIPFSLPLDTQTYLPVSQHPCFHPLLVHTLQKSAHLPLDAFMQEVFRGRTETAWGANVSAPISYTLDGIPAGENALSLARVEKYHLMERMRSRKCGEVLNAFFLIFFHIQVNTSKYGSCKSQSYTIFPDNSFSNLPSFSSRKNENFTKKISHASRMNNPKLQTGNRLRWCAFLNEN